MTQTRTATGIDVTLTGTEYCGQPVVQVEFVHPKAGKVSFQSSSFGAPPSDKTARGIIGRGIIGGKMQNVCATVPKADFEAAMAEARAIGEREVAAIKSGEVKIALTYHDGEYLTGHEAFGRQAKLLVELGLAKDVDGWGTHVDHKAVEALGTEFTYAQAAEYARPALEAKQTALDAKDAARLEKFTEARRTGKPVELASWNDDCCERDFDCSLDIVTEYALPDGSTKTSRIHTH